MRNEQEERVVLRPRQSLDQLLHLVENRQTDAGGGDLGELVPNKEEAAICPHLTELLLHLANPLIDFVAPEAHVDSGRPLRVAHARQGVGVGVGEEQLELD